MIARAWYAFQRWWLYPPTFRYDVPLHHQLRAWQKPRIDVTAELLYEAGVFSTLHRWGYLPVHHDFDRNVWVFVWWPLWLPVRAAYWWLYETRLRFCAEYAMNRRIADKPEGHAWTAWTWRFRHPRNWTWRRVLPPHLRRLGLEGAVGYEGL